MDDIEKIRELEFSSQNINTDIRALEEQQADVANMLSANLNDDAKNALREKLEKLADQKEALHTLKEQNEEKIQAILQDSKPFSPSVTKTKSFIGHLVAAPASAAFNAAKSTMKSGAKKLADKADPFAKPINKNDVTDSGVETLRLAHSGIKKGTGAIKTVKKSIKTTQRTVKTTGNVIKTSGRIVYKTAVFTVKATVKTFQITGTVVSHVVATLMNPIAVVIIGIAVIFLICAMLVILLLGGGASGSATNQQAHVDAVGLVDVPEQYQEGLEFWRIAVANKRNGFYGLMDGLYYNYDDLPHSDLVYMMRVLPGTQPTYYNTSYATDGRKDALKSAWSIPLTEPEAVAIAYVYLEKAANAANDSEMGIYEVSFTQQTWNAIADKCVIYADNTYANQQCPDHNCTRHVEYIENPTYATAAEAVNTAAAAYNAWGEVVSAIYQNSLLSGPAKSAQWSSYVRPRINTWIITYNRTPTETTTGNDFLAILGAEYESAMAVLDATPAYTEQVTYICSLEHRLHSIGLTAYTAADVMNALHFTDAEKQWVELTKYGFANNPNI